MWLLLFFNLWINYMVEIIRGGDSFFIKIQNTCNNLYKIILEYLLCSFSSKQTCCSFHIMIFLIIYSTASCLFSPVSCCMIFIPASPLRNSRNRRCPPWLKSSAANSFRDKVGQIFPGSGLCTKLLTSRLKSCVKNQLQMCTVPNSYYQFTVKSYRALVFPCLKVTLKGLLFSEQFQPSNRVHPAVSTVLYDQ